MITYSVCKIPDFLFDTYIKLITVRVVRKYKVIPEIHKINFIAHFPICILIVQKQKIRYVHITVPLNFLTG